MNSLNTINDITTDMLLTKIANLEVEGKKTDLNVKKDGNEIIVDKINKLWES